MKKLLYLVIGMLLISGIGGGVYYFRDLAEKFEVEDEANDPDMPDFATLNMTKEEFVSRRAEQVGRMRGIEEDKPFNPQWRIDGIQKLERQEEALAKMPESARKDALLATWTEIGPNPIPNGQVQSGARTPVSGRTTAIAVHPTNPDIVYVGTAQGGLYRTTDGGTTWTPIMDDALSLAIGAVAIAPSQPDTIYVGTGEPNFSADSFFGVGVYRIDNASSATPIITGPLNKTSSNADIFTGRAISEIIVHPTDPATIFVSSTSGIGGLVAAATSPLPNRGVYRSTDATSANPTFTQIGVSNAGLNVSVRDIAIDPSNPNILLANSVINSTGGIMRSTDALSATPTWTQVFAFNTGTSTSNLTAEFAAIHPAADTNATFYAAVGNNAAGTGTGRMLKSTDGGATFTQVNATTFCGGQCFYNIAVDVDPTNVNNVYWGGTGTSTFRRSTDGGATSTAINTSLHTDTQVIAVAPSLPTTLYFGSDGGIYKSTNSGTSWTSLNNTTFRATQFTGLSVHPTDPNFTIGGTQDNGTEKRDSLGVWSHSQDGDGGYTAIDQNAVDTTNVTMYHTFFNQLNSQIGYERSTNAGTSWTFLGCSGTATTRGIACSSATTTAVNFYAPVALGPGNPNPVYLGTDRLLRSADTGNSNVTVSQAPIVSGVAISAIGISPQDDNVRVVGLNGGQLFGTTTGSTTLTDMDPTNAVPNNGIARVVIDPNNVNTAYVTISAFNVVNVWKTTTLNSLASNLAPTWTAAAGSGGNTLPQVPVNAFVVDPLDSMRLYAGTDIGVYTSADGGVNWTPFGTGLPRIAVFDMAITASPRALRIATHGRGMWDISLFTPSAANVAVSGQVLSSNGTGIVRATVIVTDGNGISRSVNTNSFGFYTIDNLAAGNLYTFQASAKGYDFQPQIMTVNDNVIGLNFTAGTGNVKPSRTIKKQE